MRFHKRASPTNQENHQSTKSDVFCLFELADLFHGRSLLVNVSFSIISLLPGKHDQSEYIIAQCILTDNEMRVLLPLLDSPMCCQPEVLQASFACEYQFLLQSVLFSDDANTNPQWNELVQKQRERLHRAQERKVRRTEMRGVYNALYGLRQKFAQFGLTIRARRDGYYLALFKEDIINEK